jgi:hypothetical protein
VEVRRALPATCPAGGCRSRGPWWRALTGSGAPSSRSEDTHRPCNRGIVAFMPALGPIVGANAVIVVRFAPVRHSIGGVMAPITRIMAVIAAVRRRIVSIMRPIARPTVRRGRVTARTRPVADRIACVKCRLGLIM